MGLLTSLPFTYTAEEVLFLFYILSRVVGLLFISPLLANQAVPYALRLFLCIFTTLILAMSLYPDYHGDHKLFHVPGFVTSYNQNGLLIAITCLKELAVGYLLGFCFTFIFEAIALAGEQIDALVGFAVAQFVSPISQLSQSLISQMLLLVAFILMLALDLHHVFFKAITDSFVWVPLGQVEFSTNALNTILSGSNSIFTFALTIAALPFITMTLFTLSLGFVVRAIPDFNPLITGIPLRIFFGLLTLLALFNLFPTIFERAFHELTELANATMQQLSPG